jgi:hypothetical protein
MIVSVLGIFHLIHSPLLILFPFIIKNYTTDIFYIIYFLFIMLLYTFINGECPISYICKLTLNNKYIAGHDITYYPEMEYMFINKKYINYYFGIMTTIYIFTLFFVIFRTMWFSYISYILIFTFFILLNYFLFIRKFFSIKNKNVFIIFQEITKYTLLFTICFLFYCLFI